MARPSPCPPELCERAVRMVTEIRPTSRPSGPRRRRSRRSRALVPPGRCEPGPSGELHAVRGRKPHPGPPGLRQRDAVDQPLSTQPGQPPLPLLQPVHRQGGHRPLPEHRPEREPGASPGPRKTVLAAASIAGAVLIAVPIALVGRSHHTSHPDSHRAAPQGDTVLATQSSLPSDGYTPSSPSASPTHTAGATATASAKAKHSGAPKATTTVTVKATAQGAPPASSGKRTSPAWNVGEI